jgi:hypothetical protein
MGSAPLEIAPMIETRPMEQAGEANERMMSGAALDESTRCH